MMKGFTLLHHSSQNERCTLNDSLTKTFPFSSAFGKITFSIVLLFAFSLSTFAQITAGFELEGNAVAVAPNPPDDWDLIYNNASHAQVNTGVVTDLPPGADN